MKKFVILVFLFLFPFKVYGISASSYIVMDGNSGRVLEGSNIDNKSLIASITKIMTCIIALEYGDKEEIITIDDSIISSYGSGIYIQIGEKLTLDDLLYGLMLRSGNDAALQIASSVSGSVESFVYLMNEKAMSLGMVNTSFINPTGLEDNNGNGNMSTVYDMALLFKYALYNEDFKRIISTEEIVVKSSLKTYKWINKNKLLNSYEYCIGGKTGYTKKAHRTLVTGAIKDDMNLIVVTFNDGNDFGDHKSLYEKYFNNYKSIKLLDKNIEYSDNCYVKNDLYYISKGDEEFSTKVIMNDVSKPFYGEVVGRVDVYVDDKRVGYRYLYYMRDLLTINNSISSNIDKYIRGIYD